MRGIKFIVPAIVLIGVVVFQSLFIVQEISQAIVLQFGDPKKIVTKAGLNFKLPFIQNVVYLDKRILNLDNDPEEVIAADQKRLIVDAFARFKNTGEIFNKDLADKYRKFILEKGGTEDPMELYRSFAGSNPDISALLSDRGLE